MAIEKTTSEKSYEEIFEEELEKLFPKFKEEEYKIACEIRDKIKNNIKNNVYKFQLSERYQEWKDKQNLGKVPLDLTGHYLESINVVATETGYVVQIDDVIHQNIPGKGQNTMNMRDLGSMLEYGDGKLLHPMPHWRPVIFEYNAKKGTIKERFNALIEKVHARTITRMQRETRKTTKL